MKESIKKEFIQIYMGSTFSPLPFIPTLPIINFLEILQALPQLFGTPGNKL